jgi:hypothetical protein
MEREANCELRAPGLAAAFRRIWAVAFEIELDCVKYTCQYRVTRSTVYRRLTAYCRNADCNAQIDCVGSGPKGLTALKSHFAFALALAFRFCVCI